MHEVLVNRLGGLSLSRQSVVRLTDRPDMTIDDYRGRKTTMQQQQQHTSLSRARIKTLHVHVHMTHMVKIDIITGHEKKDNLHFIL